MVRRLIIKLLLGTFVSSCLCSCATKPAPLEKRNNAFAEIPSIKSKGSTFTSPAVDAYTKNVVEAIRSKWFKLLDKVPKTSPGKVVINFMLHSNGTVTDVKIVEGENVEKSNGMTCSEAIRESAPFAAWPEEMVQEALISAKGVPNQKDVTFTFYYLDN